MTGGRGAGYSAPMLRWTACCLALVACSTAAPPEDQPDAAGEVRDAGTEVPDAGVFESPAAVKARPYALHVPTGYDGARAVPLVILLHGYSGSAEWQETYFRLTRVADAKTFLYATPEGTVDAQGKRFWNATDACCDFYGVGVDDVAYVNAIIDDASGRFRVDPRRVYVVGHSNGAFMAHRLACDLAPRIAAVVSLAGAQWLDVTRCRPAAPVAVLEVHGDQDSVVRYGGGHPLDNAQLPLHPGALVTVGDWATLDGCTTPLAESGETLDVDLGLAGAETVVARAGGCRGGAAELWTIRGGEHVPALGASWADLVWGFLEAHPKP